MSRALIDSENSFLRNAIGLILFVLIILVVMIMVLPFALFGRPAKITATEVADYLNNFIEDKGEAWDWDDFISVAIANPKLESIRARASQVELPLDEEGLVALRLLLSEAEELIKADAACSSD